MHIGTNHAVEREGVSVIRIHLGFPSSARYMVMYVQSLPKQDVTTSRSAVGNAEEPSPVTVVMLIHSKLFDSAVNQKAF